MLSVDLTPASVYADRGSRMSRLIVTRRGVDDGRYRAIGYLDRTLDVDDVYVYEFAYLESAASARGFVPLVGFKDVRRHYRSRRLFPSFADRVMSAKRPDRPQYLAALDLGTDADVWEILSASGGYREGDPIELVPLPSYERVTGRTSACFLSHGVRYLDVEANTHLTGLSRGSRLALEVDPFNPVNARAVRIVDGPLRLGYVPDPLLDHVEAVLESGTYRLEVVKANRAETHPHLRLLLRLIGRCDGYVFDRPEWRSV